MAVTTETRRRPPRTPFSYLDGRIGFGRGSLRAVAAAAMVASVAIVVVRVFLATSPNDDRAIIE